MSAIIPSDISGNSRNVAQANIVARGQLSQCNPRGPEPSYRFNIFPCQLRHGMPFSDLDGSPSFHVHIPKVIQLSAKKEVKRSNTNRVIASVKHKHSIWNVTMVQNPREPVGVYDPAVSSSFSYLPVTMLTDTSIPEPALLGLFDPLEKPVGNCCRKTSMINGSFVLHPVSQFDCLPRLRLFVQRAGFYFSSIGIQQSIQNRP